MTPKEKQWLVVTGLLVIQWASLACPPVFWEAPLSLVLHLRCEPFLEAAFGRDATAAPLCSFIPPPDNESHKMLTGSCIGENSTLQLLIKSKHPYFQQREVGLLDPGQRDLFCTVLVVFSVCFPHLGWCAFECSVFYY